MAIDRLVEMEISGVGHVSGQPTCPDGFDMEHDTGLNLEDKWCPEARIDSVELPSGEPAALRRGGISEIHVFGRQLSPSTCPGDFPPCAGPAVFFGLPQSPPRGIAVLDTVWLGIDHLLVTVQVAPDAPLGPARINARNPRPRTRSAPAPAASPSSPPPHDDEPADSGRHVWSTDRAAAVGAAHVA